MVPVAFVELSLLWLSGQVRCSHLLTKKIKYTDMEKKNSVCVEVYVLKFHIGQFKATELCLQQRPILLCQEASSTITLSTCLNRDV